MNLVTFSVSNRFRCLGGCRWLTPRPSGKEPWFKLGVTRSGRMCYHLPLYYVGAGLLQRGLAWMSGAQVSTDFRTDNPSFGVTGVMFLGHSCMLESADPARAG